MSDLMEEIIEASENENESFEESNLIQYNLAELGLEEYESNTLVQKNVHELKLFFGNRSNCRCRNENEICFEKIGFKNFFERYMELKGLEKDMKDLCIKTQLMTFELVNENSTKSHYNYKYNSSIPICQKVFLKLNNISRKLLDTLQAHFKTNGLESRIHGNTKRIPKIKSRSLINAEVANTFKEFVLQYAKIYGLPSPMKLRDDLEPFIYLPTEITRKNVYEEYKKNLLLVNSNLNSRPIPIIALQTFRKLWQQLTPEIKFLNHASDLCDTCYGFDTKLMSTKDKDEIANINFEYEKHKKIAMCEREHYNNIITKGKTDFSINHICYDWAQSVVAPYSPQQTGSIYFKSPFNIHLFGVCRTDGNKNYQLNYIIGEDEFPKGTHKGANTTLNMVYDFLKKVDHADKKDLYVTCDNCSGQNKNNLSLWFWSWIIMLGWYENIYINFMIPGHTKFICDANFGHIKSKYKNRRINTVDDVAKAIKDSAECNEPIRYGNGSNWSWYNFTLLFEGHFRSLPNITKYHHFRFSSLSDDIGKVYVSKKSGGTEIPFKLLKDDNFDKNSQLDVLEIAPLSEDRKRYLYNKIRQHVDPEFRNILCPNPN
jgi:hypothetical protein